MVRADLLQLLVWQQPAPHLEVGDLAVDGEGVGAAVGAPEEEKGVPLRAPLRPHPAVTISSCLELAA
jgi:hypothetical protein